MGGGISFSMSAILRKRIVSSLSEYSLGEILTEKGMPKRALVLKWMREDHDFAGKCLDARRERAELLLERCQNELFSADDVKSSKVAEAKIRHLEWYLERLIPVVYGRRTRLDVGGNGVAALLAEARKRQPLIIEAEPHKLLTEKVQ